MAIDYSDVISTLAFVTALFALGWNIVRDILIDRVDIKFNLAFGEVGSIKHSETGIFADAGSLPNHLFDDPGLLVQIINTGRRPIGVSGIGGELKNGFGIYMAVAGLPKMLQPYEVFSATTSLKPDLFQKLKENKISSLWVMDTKGTKWELSEEGWVRLKRTQEYISSGKHLRQ